MSDSDSDLKHGLDVVPVVGDVVPPAQLVVRAPPPPAEEIVERWYADTFHNLALPTDLQNRFHAAKETLKRALRALE